MMTAKLLIDIPAVNWAYTIVLDAGKEYSFGTGRDNTLSFPPGSASPRHAAVLNRGRWFIRDLGSNEGTFVNGDRISESQLTDGDLVRLGKCEIMFQNPSDKVGLDEWSRTRSIVAEREFALREAIEKHTPETVVLEGLDDDIAEAETLTDMNRIASVGSASPAPKRNLGPDDMIWVAQTLSTILTGVLSQPGSREETFALMLRHLKDAIGADNGFVMIPNFDTGRWVIRAWVGDAAAWTSYEKSHPVPLTVTNRAYELMTVVSNALSAGDDEDDDIESASMVSLKVNGYIAVPLVNQGKRRGVLYFDTRNTAREFDPKHVKLLERAGSYIIEIEDQKVTG